MSLTLLYFDEGPLHLLAGQRGEMFFNEADVSVKRGGATVAARTLAVSHNWSAGPFRAGLDAVLHRELLSLITARLDAGRTPRLLFHWFDANEDTIEATGEVEVSVRDVEGLYEILRATPNDAIVRITGVENPIRVSAEEVLVERLAEGQLPQVDGVLFGDGGIVVMEHRVELEGGSSRTSVRPLVRSTVAAFVEYNPNQWVSMRALSSAQSEGDGGDAVKVTVGAGGLETDGFVEVRRLDDETLVWAAYFQGSTPFEEVALEKGVVVARAASGHRWRFPLERPDLVRVEAPAP